MEGGLEGLISGFQNSAPQKLVCFGTLDLDPEKSAGSANTKELDLILLAVKSSKQTKDLLCVEESGKLPDHFYFYNKRKMTK